MKKFLTSITLFAFGVLCLLALAEYVARACPNAYRLKDEWMQQHAPEAEVLVLGSSHAYAGIHAEQLGCCAYNLANSNQTQRYDWLLLSRDSARLSSLRTVVYPTSSLLMNYAMEQTSEWYRCIYYHLYNQLEDRPLWSRYAWEVASIQTCCWKVQSFFLSGSADRMCDAHGWCSYYQASDADRLNPAELAARLDKYDERAVLPADPQAGINQIASLCDRRGWRLLLVGMPVSGLFADDPRGCEQLGLMDAQARALQARHASVDYVDFSRSADFPPAMFFDVDHLNDLGATHLSLLLRQHLDAVADSSRVAISQ